MFPKTTYPDEQAHLESAPNNTEMKDPVGAINKVQ